MLDYFRTSYFIPPPYITLDDFSYMPKVKTYSEYNYLGSGLPHFLKTRHFEYALRLAKRHLHGYNAIDFGCADGALLPSLSKRFDYVTGIDREPDFVKLAGKVVDLMGLRNVDLICNDSLTFDDLRRGLPDRKYHVLFLLETLEHIGDKDAPWESKVEFVKGLFTLLDKSGVIIISVPVMVGLPLLVQRVGLFVFNAKRDKVSQVGLLKACFLNDTSDLEKQWQPWHMGETRHIGFNHKKLERCLRRDFDILETKNILFQIIYVCRNRR